MLHQVNLYDLQLLLKRPRPCSFDGCESEASRPIKRHRQQPSIAAAPNHPLDRSSRPSRSEPAPLTPPESSQYLNKSCFRDKVPLPETSTNCHIEAWLEGVRPRRNSLPCRREYEDSDTDIEQRPSARRNSCPPRTENSGPDIGKGQRPLMTVLQQMSRSDSRKQNLGAGSVSSARSSSESTSHADYRKILRNNGVHIDYTGVRIPEELRGFLDLHILKERSTKLSAEAISRAVETALKTADDPEYNIYNLTNTAMFPIKRPDIGCGGNTPWLSDALPRNTIYPASLAAPKADIHLGYLTDQDSDWQVAENAVIDHRVAKRLTQPAKGNCFPFCLFELKSEAMGSNLWQAENQAAGGGASCVNIMCWLFREAYGSDVQSVIDTIAFSVCVTHRLTVFNVHFYMPKEKKHYMSRIATCDPLCQVEKSSHLVENILEHCLGERQRKVREALARLYPFPEHWKNSRPASAMEWQDSTTDVGDASNKHQRTE